MNGIALDPRLESDSVFIADGPLSQWRLINDDRYPWLVLVPRVPGASELTDLDGGQQRLLLAEVNLADRLLRDLGDCEKINIGLLGNIVRQLHVHVVSRNARDEAWPAPVWGRGPARVYAPDALERLLARLREGMATLSPAGD